MAHHHTDKKGFMRATHRAATKNARALKAAKAREGRKARTQREAAQLPIATEAFHEFQKGGLEVARQAIAARRDCLAFER